MLKRCTKCGEERPLDRFPFRYERGTKVILGYQTVCTPCASAAARARRNANPEKYKKTPEQKARANERSRKWRWEHRSRHSASRKLQPSRQASVTTPAHYEWIARNPEKARSIAFRHGLRKYGITPEEWREIYGKQEGRCAICADVLEQGSRKTATDHDHDTGKVRGILCWRCNPLLGWARESVDVLEKAIDYLNFHKRPRLALTECA